MAENETTTQQVTLPPDRWHRYTVDVDGFSVQFTTHGIDETHALNRFMRWFQDPTATVVLTDTGMTVAAVWEVEVHA